MSYSNASLVVDLLGRALTSAETTLLPYIFSAADGYIDDACETHFGSTTETRYFDGNIYTNDLGRILIISPCTSVVSVKHIDRADNSVIYTLVENEDYYVSPANEDVKSYIEFANLIPAGLQNIAVEASWGSGTVPDDIIYCATYLACRYLNLNSNTANNVSGPLTKESIEGYSREFAGSNSDAINISFVADAVVVSILKKYMQDEVLL